jgi:aspartate-semialdehyde dehydrogenase
MSFSKMGNKGRDEDGQRNQKILRDESVRVTATTVRIPVVGGHMKQ